MKKFEITEETLNEIVKTLSVYPYPSFGQVNELLTKMQREIKEIKYIDDKK